MKAKQELKDRHISAVSALVKASKGKTKRYGLVRASYEVGKSLGVSPNTVINYLRGKSKDGYLTDAITSEFRTLQIND